MLPPILDKSTPQEHVEVAGGLFKAVELAFEVAHFGCTIREAGGLANVNILFDGGMEERSVDVNMTDFELHSGRNGEKEPKASPADDQGEGLSVVEAHASTAALGDETSFESRDVTLRVGLDLVNPHVVDDHTVGGEISYVPRAVVHKGVILMLHRCLSLLCLHTREGNTVRRGLDTYSGGQQSNDAVTSVRRWMCGDRSRACSSVSRVGRVHSLAPMC
jgi:hypothetical protein